MARYGRKKTGGRINKQRKKKLYEKKGQPRLVLLGEQKKKTLRTKGGSSKVVLLKGNKINVFDKDSKKTKIVKINNVLEVPSNRFLARKNVLVKGAIVETDLGKVKITNRPSQEPNIQGILIK